MTEFPKNGHFKVLVVLHHFGLLSLPNYYEAEWKNWVHRNCYRNGVILLQILLAICQTILTFRYAVHELSQFLQRIFEMFVFHLIIPSGIIYNIKLGSIITLFHRMDNFSRANRTIFDKYRKKEWSILVYYGAIFGVAYSVLILDALLPAKETVDLMARLYHRTEPVRLFPVMIWVPLIDTNQLPVFIVIYVLEIYWILTVAFRLSQILVMELVFPLALAGQFEMLGTFVKLLGAEHRNEEGRLIRYTDVVHGEYRLVDVELSGEARGSALSNNSPSQNRKEALEAIEYERNFLRNILLRQKELLSFLDLYTSIMRPAFDATTIHTIGSGVISVYQIFIMSGLPRLAQVKMSFEFIILFLTCFNMIDESERMNSVVVSLAQSLYGSQWYRLRSADTRKSALLMLRNCQREMYLVHMRGLLVHNREMFLRVSRHAYSFANYMKLRSQF